MAAKMAYEKKISSTILNLVSTINYCVFIKNKFLFMRQLC